MNRSSGSALAALAFACLPAAAWGQIATATTATAADAAGEEGEQIVVTGTRDRARTQFDTMAPVDVLSASAIQSSVSGDLSDSLAQLLPSFNVQRLPAADGLAFVRPATLRGLSPDQTLVLVNGKRYHRSALLGTRGAQAADLASIPTAGIGRIEVLRDGAAAQYGSDAIAGVINVLLEDRPGMDAWGQASRYYAGDGNEYQWGMRGGVALGTRGTIVLTGQYDRQEATSRTRQRPDAITFQANNPTLAVPNPVQRWGQPDSARVSGALNAHYDLADDAAVLYAFGTVQSGEGVTDFNWRNPADTTSVYRTAAAFPGFTFRSVYPAGFTPRFGTQFGDLQAAGGVRGDLGARFHYDLSASSGRSRIRYTLGESLNASLGPNSPTSFYLGRLQQREFNLNADFTYRLPVPLGEPLNVAFGAERRVESYSVAAGDPASYAIGAGAANGLAPNASGFPGFSPVQAGAWSQRSYAGYLDLEWKPATPLTLGAAGRYEDFSVFGDTFNYKLSARFEPVTGLAARATYATGFRAPTPGQRNTRQVTQGLNNQLQVFNQGRLSPSDPIAIALGATPLRPETSRSATAGLVAQLGSGINITADLYQIDVDDRLGQSIARTVPTTFANPDRFTAVTYFTNDFDTRTRGIDAVASLVRAVGPGRANLSLAYNYNQTRVRSGTSAAIANTTQRRIFEERLPQHNATGTVGYDLGPVGVMLRGRYYGPWTDVTNLSTGDPFQRFGGIALFDVAVTWQVTRTVSLRGGAENVFDRYPDKALNQANRGLIYSRNAPYDTDGGQYYLRAGLRF